MSFFAKKTPRKIRKFYVFYTVIFVLSAISFIISLWMPFCRSLFGAFAGLGVVFFFTIGFYRWKYFSVPKRLISLLIGVVASIFLYAYNVNTVNTVETGKSVWEDALLTLAFVAPAISFISLFFANIIRAKYKNYFFTGILFPFLVSAVPIGINMLLSSSVIGFIGDIVTVIIGVVLFSLVFGGISEDTTNYYNNYVTVEGGGDKKYYHEYDNVYSDGNGNYYWVDENNYMHPKER